MSTVRVGTAATASGSRYLQQLCKHWSHKFPVDFDADRGVIDLPMGRVELEASADQLQALLKPSSADTLDRVQAVVEEHLNRFAFREAPLPFAWHDEEREP